MSPLPSVMLPYCWCFWFVLLLMTFLNVSAMSSSVMVKFNETATLTCSQTCSDLVTWTVSHKQLDILAQCDQTSCQSQEGFHMSHDQYLKGDLSLTITDVDFTKRGWYMCECDGVDLCHVTLQIESLRSSVQLMPGDPLVLDLPISESVEVIYNSADAAAPKQICTVEGHTLQCKPEYSQRTSFMSAVELRGTEPSDSGVYTIRDLSNKWVIQTYTVSVQEFQPCPADQSSTVMVLAVLLALTWVGLVAGLVAAGLMIAWQRKTIQQLQRGHADY
ncbi:uncharacterized protein LOC143509887 isoform X2 [Brachyhypopomus gauderio]|uniref:uncharacterized protein LOC143509887 isoform X2 n=1 Tax=Brachyhypopomus gauderio TaxID=698409 RepID=UPI00404150A1